MEPPLSPCSCLLVLCPQKQMWKKHTKCLYPPLPTSHSNTQMLEMSVSTAWLPGRPGGALCIAWEVSAASGERGGCYDFPGPWGGWVGRKTWCGRENLASGCGLSTRLSRGRRHRAVLPLSQASNTIYNATDLKAERTSSSAAKE